MKKISVTITDLIEPITLDMLVKSKTEEALRGSRLSHTRRIQDNQFAVSALKNLHSGIAEIEHVPGSSTIVLSVQEGDEADVITLLEARFSQMETEAKVRLLKEETV